MSKEKMAAVSKVLPAMEVDMGGISVLQPIPTFKVNQIDPFLLVHHHHTKIKSGNRPGDLGVGPHPHRGFSPVTFIFRGDVHHRDSRGNSSIVKAGGVQWMNAGMGIIHSERPSKELAENGGEQEIVQLWINTPAARKMKEPKYFAVQKDEMPRLENIRGDVRLVAGNYNSLAGPVQGEYPITALMGNLSPNDKLQVEKQTGENAFIYILNGLGRLEGYGLVEEKNLYQLEPDAVAFFMEAKSELSFVYVSATPLHEKVEQYGPYVMNSQTEILEAMRDYQMGKMGFLVEDL